MKCNDAVKKFMELDDYRNIPLALRLHIKICRKCREEFAEFSAALDSLSLDSPYNAPRGLVSGVMSIILRENPAVSGRISGAKWVTAGTVIFASILLINFSESFIWLEGQFGSSYTVPLGIVLGLVLTAYSAIVVACNYEYMKKYLDHLHK